MKPSFIKVFAEQVRNSEAAIEEDKAVFCAAYALSDMWKSISSLQRK